MAQLKRNSSLSLNKDMPYEIQPHLQRTIKTADVLTDLTVLAEHIGWNYNGVLTGIYFKVAADIWKAVLKVEVASGPKVAYFTNTSLLALVETVHWYCSKGLVSWHHDKRPVRVSKRSGVYSNPHQS